MPQPRPASLRDALRPIADRAILAADRAARFEAIAGGASLAADPAELRGKSVVIATRDQLSTALALIDLDGLAGRMVLLPPDSRPEHMPAICAAAEADAIVTDSDPAAFAGAGVARIIPIGMPGGPAWAGPRGILTEWVLLTSGTTGVPKMAVHSLAGLAGAIPPGGADETAAWATFYDIRRYGGLQIFLRAVLGNASLVLSEPGEPVVDHLRRLAAAGVTHISGTPSHWRRVLMSASADLIRPRYVRLSGEIADQAVLTALREAYPDASIGHAYASTEAGVGFAVDDGREGFPAAFVDQGTGGVDIRVEDGMLRIRSARTASRYLGADAPPLAAPDGFVDTGDMVERRGDRYHFVGRRGGIINVGGLKVHPEEVEAVINRHGGVRASLVRARKSPILGAIVVADVVPAEPATGADGLKDAILRHCRSALPQHKVPATIRLVEALDVTAAGKLARGPHE